MDITPLIAADRQVIQSYGAGRFKISGRVYGGPVIVFPDRTEEWVTVSSRPEPSAALAKEGGAEGSDPADSGSDPSAALRSARDDFDVEMFSPVLKHATDLDVILFGCGAAMPADAPALRRKLKERGLAIDIMPTGAACRTYNVLLSEGRRVAAALLPA